MWRYLGNDDYRDDEESGVHRAGIRVSIPNRGPAIRVPALLHVRITVGCCNYTSYELVKSLLDKKSLGKYVYPYTYDYEKHIAITEDASLDIHEQIVRYLNTEATFVPDNEYDRKALITISARISPSFLKNGDIEE